ncbi:unnamed protein product, partial [Amoebophrya sp. A25]
KFSPALSAVLDDTRDLALSALATLIEREATKILALEGRDSGGGVWNNDELRSR